MKLSLRLLSRSLLVPLLCIGLGGTAGAETPSAAQYPGVTGNYLAGSQALFDLRTEDAARFLRQALVEGWDNPFVVERSFIAYAANGNIEEAATTARHLLELKPQNDLARLVIATEAVKRRSYDTAIAELEEVGTDNFAGITGGILRAWAYTGDGRVDEAFGLLDSIGQNGLEDFLVFHRALMADVSGRSDIAIDNARRAYEVEPFVARIVEAYARMLANAGRFDEARTVLDAFADEGLTHPLVAVVNEAVDDRRRPGLFAASVQTGAAEMFHGIGVALARDGSTDLALVFLRLGLYPDPEADVIALVLGQILDEASQHQAANDIYEAVPATSSMKSTAIVRVAENLDSMGNRDEALRRLRNIVRSSPDDLDALSVLGDLQRTAERYADAAATYTRAIELVPGDAPSDWRFYYVRGIAYERNKEWPQAEADFKRALELRPDQPQVLNYLGYSWVDQGMNLEAALEMIETAVAAAPNDGYIIDSLGWAFYRLGRYDEAVETLERAVQLRPNDPEINDHLGDAYWHADRQLEARFQWNIAAAMDEEGNVKERVLPKLAARFPEPSTEAVSAEAEADEAVSPASTQLADAPEAPAEPASQPQQPGAGADAQSAVEPEAEPEPQGGSEPEAEAAAAIEAEPAAEAAAEAEPATETEPTAETEAPAGTESAAEAEPEAAETEPAAEPEPAETKAAAEDEPESAAEPDVETATAPEFAMDPEPLHNDSRTVLPGDNLWDIARQVYGKGADYRLIVEANREKLGDPDLIQPGLVLVLPSAP